MALAQGDVFEHTLRFDFQGSVILNVFHYRVKTVSGTIQEETAFTALDTALEDNVYGIGAGLWLNKMNENVTLQESRYQKLFPSRQRYYSLPKNSLGQVPGQPTPSNLAAVLAAQTDSPIRGASASKHLAGFTVTDLDGEFWDAAMVNDLSDAWDWAIPEIIIIAPSFTVVPVTYNPETQNTNDIVSVRPIYTPRVMRRRTKGYGI